MSKQKLILSNVFVNNLKGVDLELDLNQLIVFSGVSGSGKSSLAFETIYLEGQRRYIESLSAHSKRVLKDLPRPKADKIEGISPTIAVEQKNTSGSIRSTVGTLTGIYDYMRILFAKVASPHCPISGEKVEPLSKDTIVQAIEQIEEGSRLIILAPLIKGKKSNLADEIDQLLKKGFLRARIDGSIVLLEDVEKLDPKKSHDLDVVVDRIVLEKNSLRLKEAVYSALELSEGSVVVVETNSEKSHFYSTFGYSEKSKKFYEPLHPANFSFNHVNGMCENCHGLGIKQEFDLSKIIDENLSIAEDCCNVAPSYQTVRFGNIYRNLARIYDFKIDTPWKKLSKEIKEVFLHGTKQKWSRMYFTHPVKKNRWVEYVQYKGVLHEANERYLQASSDSYKKKMEELMTMQTCDACKGSRLKPYPSSAKLQNKTIHELVSMPLDELLVFFETLKLPATKQKIAKLLLKEVVQLLEFLIDVGVGYLSLERISPTLSGGEAQRVKLASFLGCGLVGITYILDEPSIGLHQRDNQKLIQTLQKLKSKGNTIIVVEHDEETMMSADTIVDIGPGAGSEGGQIMFNGPIEKFLKADTTTANYLTKKLKLTRKQNVKKAEKAIRLQGARHHNLQNVEISVPLERFTTITGVSGSGKSTLVLETLYPALANQVNRQELKEAPYEKLEGAKKLDKVIAIDQSPIGRSPRSNPATYTKIFDFIRDLYTKLPESIARGYKAGRFSFNVKEGSCPRCVGNGSIRIEMDFIEDSWIECPECHGRRFDEETLSIFYRSKNISDVLQMSILEAVEHFENIPYIKKRLQVLVDVGLGYLKLGQSATTLSGGEAQRIKLSKELTKSSRQNALYIFDEPTTGLHFDDIKHLLHIFDQLVIAGHTLVVIEHNLDIIANSDHIIELGPEGGKRGGKVIATGSVAEVAKTKTPTGVVLKAHLEEKVSAHAVAPPKEDANRNIAITKAGQHNLKELSVEIPRNEISVFTGPSGSGKSSLVFDTLFSEGQRRYTDTLSSYLRTFIKQMPAAKVEAITNLLPSIAIEQKSHSLNPRSTVGTLTEIYDFLRLLFAHAGVPHCPETKEVIQAVSKAVVVDRLLAQLPEKKLIFLSPIPSKLINQSTLERFKRQGFLRVRLNQEIIELDSMPSIDTKKQNTLELVVDRVICRAESKARMVEAIELAAKISDQKVLIFDGKKDHFFNLSFSVPSTGKSYPEITPQTFLFNHEKGMCLQCQGLGYQFGANFSENSELMESTIEDIFDDLLGGVTFDLFELLEPLFDKYAIDPSIALHKLKPKQLKLFLLGSDEIIKTKKFSFRYRGLSKTFEHLSKSAKKRIKEQISAIMDKVPCPFCNGQRLNPLARHVTIEEKNIAQIAAMPIIETLHFIQSLHLCKIDQQILKEVLKQLKDRLEFLCKMGVDYLSLDRSAPTLSGGELQRIRLSRQIGSKLTGVLYVLDEPTIGLHPSETKKLIDAVLDLKNLGNTLVLVEHEKAIMEMANRIYDIGPKSGEFGGVLTAEGTLQEIQKNANSLTGQYLSEKKQVLIEPVKSKLDGSFAIQKATHNNLKNVDVEIPLGKITVSCGPSGSGKSSLHEMIKLANQKRITQNKEGFVDLGFGKVEVKDYFDQVISLDQNPNFHTTRADVASFCDLLAPLRQWFAKMPEAQARGLEPKYFSYYHKKGACKTCFGFGYKTIDLQLMPRVKIECPDCKGKRLNPLSLSVKYKGKSIADYLNMQASELLKHFDHIAKPKRLLETLIKTGLDYVRLNQEIHTLSGGEAQRLRLATDLAKRVKGKNLYLFDEPTIGLHFSDIEKLIKVFFELKEKGHSVVIIEHNIDIIKHADHLIELGPKAGQHGGKLMFQGTVNEMKKAKTLTSQFL